VNFSRGYFLCYFAKSIDLSIDLSYNTFRNNVFWFCPEVVIMAGYRRKSDSYAAMRRRMEQVVKRMDAERERLMKAVKYAWLDDFTVMMKLNSLSMRELKQVMRRLANYLDDTIADVKASNALRSGAAKSSEKSSVHLMTFSELKIPAGSILVFDKNRNVRAVVVDDTHVLFEAKEWLLTDLVVELHQRMGVVVAYDEYQGRSYFKYCDESLSDRQKRIERGEDVPVKAVAHGSLTRSRLSQERRMNDTLLYAMREHVVNHPAMRSLFDICLRENTLMFRADAFTAVVMPNVHFGEICIRCLYSFSWTQREEDDRYFRVLLANRDVIDREVDRELEWIDNGYQAGGEIQCHVKADVVNRDAWSAIFSEVEEALTAMRGVFRKYIRG
jgi:exonuclease VII small subunit